jgi:hypothetical protein
MNTSGNTIGIRDGGSTIGLAAFDAVGFAETLDLVCGDTR